MIKKLLLFTCAALTFAACSESSDNEDGRPTPPAGYLYASQNTAIGSGALTSAMLFFGESSVKTIATNSLYTDPAARFEFKQEADNIYLYMHATRFASGMPAVEMRLTAPATLSGTSLKMASASVIPQSYLAATNEWVDQPRYTITELSASVEGTLCAVRFTCAGAFDTSYLGSLIVKAN